MASATLVVAVGAEVLDECTGRFGVPTRKAIMIPNGRDATLFHPRSSPGEADPATLIFVGALTAQKQPDRFVQVVGQLRREGRDVRAVIVGDGPLAPTLEAMAAASGVDLFGAREDVPELLRDSDVLVFTSRPAGEGMPGVLIEAGLSGIPAVSTPVPGATAVLGEGSTGIVVEDSVAAIAAAVGDLVDDPARRTTMGASARIRCVSEFGLDVMAERWDAALRPLLEGQTGTAHPGTRTIDRVGAFLERFSVRPVADRARRR